MDFVGRFEHLPDEAELTLKNLGVQFVMPKLNATDHPHHRDSLTESAVRRIYDIWRPDFINFQYSID